MFKTLLIIMTAFSSASALSSPTPLLQGDLKTWYEKETNLTAGEYFGIYSIKVIKNKVYIGIGTDRPASMDGAMLASLPTEGGAPSNIAFLNEQGFVDMMIAGNYLHIPGADPGFPQFAWDSGNWYRLNLVEATPKIELKRNLPFVVHGWGHWFDEKTNAIYHATSEVTCDTPNPTGDCYGAQGANGHGAIFKSEDMGDSWTKIATNEDGTGTYRTYDISGSENALFATWGDHIPEGRTCGIAVSKDHGLTWERVKYLSSSCLERLIPYGAKRVLTLSQNGPFLLAISEDFSNDSNRPYSAIPLPAPPSPIGFNHIANGPAGDIIFASNAGVYKTTQLPNWELIPGTESITDTRSLHFEEATNTLFVATPAQVYKIEL